MKEGFRDSTDYYLTVNLYTGTLVLRPSLDFIDGDTLLVLDVEMTPAELANYGLSRRVRGIASADSGGSHHPTNPFVEVLRGLSASSVQKTLQIVDAFQALNRGT